MKKRFEPLDIFRGLTIFLMIVVNTPGNWSTTFSPLLHANWHGFTPTDLVFPSFLFAVGNALAFVKVKWNDNTFRQIFLKIGKRSLIIFILGYTMYWIPFVEWTDAGTLSPIPISETRILGVLQRIAICYFFAALMIYFYSPKRLIQWSVFLLIGYWTVMYAFGDYSLTGNFALVVDKILLGSNHLYMGEGIPFDPEGLLSTLPSIVNVIGGYLLGIYIKDKGMNYESLTKIMVAGIGLLSLAYIWDLSFPINKKLWTSSYVLLTIGLDLVLIALIVYFVELSARKINFNYFHVFGRNPLFIYLLSEYLAIGMLFIRVNGEQSLYSWIYQSTFSHIGGYIGSLIFALTFTMICWLAGLWLYRKNIYIRV